MEKKLEQLLDSLIEKGWKPFGYNTIDNILIEGDNYKFISRGCYSFITNIRLLVSKESGLWQFVCENEMVKGYDTSEYYTNYRRFNKENFTECRYLREYQYRIIESSLKDESKLEDFLLSNIVIKDEE